MEKFNKLSKAEMKMIGGGTSANCHVDCYDYGVENVGGSSVPYCDDEITDVVCSQYSNAESGLCVCGG